MINVFITNFTIYQCCQILHNQLICKNKSKQSFVPSVTDTVTMHFGVCQLRKEQLNKTPKFQQIDSLREPKGMVTVVYLSISPLPTTILKLCVMSRPQTCKRSRLLIGPAGLPFLTVVVMLPATAATMKHFLALYMGLVY